MAEEKVVLDPLNTETDFEAYKALRSGTAKPAEEVAEGESAGENDGEAPAPGKESQEPEKPKKDRSFDGRISELTAARKKAEERATQLEQELAEARKPRQEARTEPKAEPKPEPKAEDDEPDLDAFVEGGKYDTWGKATKAWKQAHDAWRDGKAKVESEQKQREQSETEAQQAAWRRIGQTRDKRPDFEEKVKAVDFSKLPNDMSLFIRDSEQTGEFVYHFSIDQAEMNRIAQIQNPKQREKELLKLELRFESEAAQSEEPPEPKKAPVTKAPPPIRSITSGGTPGKPKDLNEINDFEEYKKTRAAAKR